MAAMDHWNGLGQREGALAPAPQPEPLAADQAIDQDPDFDRPSIRRTVPASSAPPVAVTQPSSVFTSYLKPGEKPPVVSDVEEDPPAPPPPEQPPLSPFRSYLRPGQQPPVVPDEPSTPQEPKPMVRTKKAPARATKPAKKRGSKRQPTRDQSPQLHVCTALAQAGGMLDRSALFAVLEAHGIERTGAYQALHGARGSKRVERKGTAYELTAQGRAWLDNERDVLGLEPVVAPALRGRRKADAAAPALAVATRDEQALAHPNGGVQIVQERSFRCAVFSDGGFSLAKNGQAIELSQAETKEMVRYLERMAEQAA